MSVSREEIQPNNDRNERYKTVVQKWSRKGRETEEEEEGGRKWLGVQIRAGRSFLGDDCARAFFFFSSVFQFISVFLFSFLFFIKSSVAVNLFDVSILQYLHMYVVFSPYIICINCSPPGMPKQYTLCILLYYGILPKTA